jgi:hypothetical protein
MLPLCLIGSNTLPSHATFYANALDAWYNMNLIFSPRIQCIADLRYTPLWKFTLLTPYISGHTGVLQLLTHAKLYLHQ